MENFTFKSPTQFILVWIRTKEPANMWPNAAVKGLWCFTAAVLCCVAAFLHEVVDSLDAAGVDCVTLGGVQPNPGSSFVYKAIEAAREARVDFLLAVGGGSVIDTAKRWLWVRLMAAIFWIFTAVSRWRRLCRWAWC